MALTFEKVYPFPLGHFMSPPGHPEFTQQFIAQVMANVPLPENEIPNGRGPRQHPYYNRELEFTREWARLQPLDRPSTGRSDRIPRPRMWMALAVVGWNYQHQTEDGESPKWCPRPGPFRIVTSRDNSVLGIMYHLDWRDVENGFVSEERYIELCELSRGDTPFIRLPGVWVMKNNGVEVRRWRETLN